MTSPLEPAARPDWSLIELCGRRCELFHPPAAPTGRALIYLHDVAERRVRDISGLRDAIEAAGLPVVAPYTGRSWWLDRIMPGFDARITPERFVVEEVRAEIVRRFAVQPPGIALIGAGMGGQGALRIAYRHPTLFPVAAAIAPAIDFHMAMRECDLREDGERYDTLWETYGDVERARQDTAILHVHPLNWPRHQWFSSDPADVDWHDGAVRLQSKLRALGIPHTAVLEPPARQAGNLADRMTAEALRFILNALDEESRRLA